MGSDRRGTLVVLLCAALNIVSPIDLARAEDALADTDRSAKARALRLFKRGKEEYRLGLFKRAAATLRQAYALHPEPVLQYNLARTLEGLGDTRGAIEAYERYLLDATDIPDRGAVARRIVSLKEQQRRTEALQREREQNVRHRSSAAARALTPKTQPPAAPAAVTHTNGSGALLGPLITSGTGVATLIGATVVGIVARSKHNSATEDTVQRSAADKQDSAESLAMTANVMFAIGGALAAGGVIWWLVQHFSNPEHGGSSKVSALVGPRGLQVVGRF